ncbi:MAG: hypothetical protein ABI591_21780 [Kofleriaceae bacterium]
MHLLGAEHHEARIGEVRVLGGDPVWRQHGAIEADLVEQALVREVVVRAAEIEVERVVERFMRWPRL